MDNAINNDPIKNALEIAGRYSQPTLSSLLRYFADRTTNLPFTKGAEEKFRQSTALAPGETHLSRDLDEMRKQLPIALFALRSTLAGSSMKPFNPSAPNVPMPLKPDAENVGQNIYEALLGRTRKPGEQLAEPGSGWWHIGNQPIPKLSNILAWLGAGGVGYGIWNAGGGPDLLEKWHSLNTPGSPEYEADQDRTAGLRAEIGARNQDYELAKALAIAHNPKWYEPPGFLTDDEQKQLDAQRLPGGVGSSPY
jgi:hypothetical protein